MLYNVYNKINCKIYICTVEQPFVLFKYYPFKTFYEQRVLKLKIGETVDTLMYRINRLF